MIRHPFRRGASALTTLALTAAGLAVLGAATAPPSQARTAQQAAPVAVDAATLTWGLSGYAQKGIFGPWTFRDLDGNVTQLVGTTTTGATNTQTEYLVDPVPATSMPASSPQKTPNAVKFTRGEGTADPATGAATLTWDGSYTVNAYPAMYGAPDEIYSDPALTVDADGDGELTMGFALGAGQDMEGNPVPAQDFGRLTLLTFSDGAPERTGADGFRYAPDYQGVEVTVADGAQTRTCSTDGGATGWWGAWPETFVNSVPASIRPHFYSTSCGGMQDNKPPLPVDVDLGTVLTPEVVVSDTTLLPNGTQTVTVEGTGFDPALAVGTRPPFSGQRSGLYIAFGRYLDVWRPSASAPSSNRKNPASPNGNGVAVKWAVPTASFADSSPAQDPTAASYTELRPDGSFTAQIKVDQSWLATEAGNFGIYTYAGGGPTVAAYETATPLTFAKATPTVTLTAPTTTVGTAGTATVTVASEGGTSGSVTLSEGDVVHGTADLVDGSATVTLPADLAAGDHALTAAFTGNDNTEAGSDDATLTVAKHGSSINVVAAARRYGQDAVVEVRVGSRDGEATGAVTLRRGTTVVGTRQVAAGVARFTLSDLPVGVHALRAAFAGNATTAAATDTGTVKVQRAVGTTRFSLARPTRTAAGRAVVTVSSPTTAPTGRVTLQVRKGGALVRTATGSLRNGTVTLAIPRQARGSYRVVVTHATTATVLGSSRATTFTVR